MARPNRPFTAKTIRLTALVVGVTLFSPALLPGTLPFAGLTPVAGAARAAEGSSLAAPTGKVILDVSGSIAVTNTPEGSAAFDRAMLAAMPRSAIETTTPWTEGAQRFEGVLLADLVARLGATGTRITARALNDYSYTFDLADAMSRGALIADLTNGKQMSVRERGPLWIVFPLDDMKGMTEVERHEMQSRMVWQLKQITFN
ncbi:MAG: hypothetical protein CMO30_08240 [Tistrella sp.]|uniref:Oxidoreductase molybdopterin-binding domain-containing protein n=1 Tax=Tistrella mobilis TaxID=171437 RepID=A0A3B9INB0_9PROT|nr:hypothetical protein [Tistrella sp.]MAD40395.1 hypothetical protein [Tistrella sp.]MBA75258.1 hypothetical protein [Tistrella sp.]HAE49362.1 hypothetical protein [Tistrella mobilis]